MTNTTIAKKTRPWGTNVFVKQLMAISGLFFVLFLIVHAYGNLKMFAGQEAYDHYAHWLKSDAFYPLLPEGGLIIVFRGAMILFALLHILSAFHVWWRSRKARPTKYEMKRNIADSYAARTMRVTAIVILLGVIFHLLHFTTATIPAGYGAGVTSPYMRMVGAFSHWWVLLIYIVFVGVVAFHIGHGIWSALQTMGWLRRNTQHATIVISGIVAAIVFIMFMAPPFAIAVGFITA
ncbi:succinate dehydrogenase cytochrome b subunit [Gleimia hominis]|uniref:succinate dehydrogenase cytochrome b subunit n=1 Tax=Gleimia hominis TaxID=595468 RepID=UPI000C8025F1|nr:succinate dehydrogenase cytochrome b subunit [Gleimia hominis]WIK64619.1 succinate dehydrogenase cytochrome b subunit [Gleimia hominis]